MTIFNTTWKHDKTEPFCPPVYRNGLWHIQLHPAVITMLLTTWLAVLASFVLPSPSRALDIAQFLGLMSGGLLTLFVIGYHVGQWRKRIRYMPSLTPYTIGILEHLAVLGFAILVVHTSRLQ